MPIVSTSEGAEPNDDFIEQLTMNAEAAVKVISEMGVGDPNRVAVGGHSYGAFMTANLLTHTKLFKAGIARSGAYNRTLTPFGFQTETRTYWEVPEIYNAMSPFMSADKLHGALLIIHGEMDNNSGTFPIQSERLFSALKGHGAIARYVVLPYESHGYAAKENILHLLYECNCPLAPVINIFAINYKLNVHFPVPAATTETHTPATTETFTTIKTSPQFLPFSVPPTYPSKTNASSNLLCILSFAERIISASGIFQSIPSAGSSN